MEATDATTILELENPVEDVQAAACGEVNHGSISFHQAIDTVTPSTIRFDTPRVTS